MGPVQNPGGWLDVKEATSPGAGRVRVRVSYQPGAGKELGNECLMTSFDV